MGWGISGYFWKWKVAARMETAAGKPSFYPMALFGPVLSRSAAPD
jgi:hypothetical protein